MNEGIFGSVKSVETADTCQHFAEADVKQILSLTSVACEVSAPQLGRALSIDLKAPSKH